MGIWWSGVEFESVEAGKDRIGKGQAGKPVPVDGLGTEQVPFIVGVSVARYFTKW